MLRARLVLCMCIAWMTVACAANREPTSLADCQVTIANRSTPPGESPQAGDHGEGGLWTSLWPKGTVVADGTQIATDGSIHMKWPWWRGVDAPGQLQVEGRRLDGDSAPLVAEVNPNYGDSGFQPTTLIFPTPGCWEITATAGSARLVIVQRVVYANGAPGSVIP